MILRIAHRDDAEDVLKIYAPFIRETSLTFEIEIPSVTDFSNRITSYLKDWPWIIAESDGEIAGYAYASKYRERKGYQWSVECSIYLAEQFMSSGIATRLYAALFDILKLQGYRNVYAVINLPNDRSVRFHEKMGFKWFATYEKVGYKLGKWKDVGWWVLIVNDYDLEPSSPIPFSKLTDDSVGEILKRH